MIQPSDHTLAMSGCDEPVKGGLLRWVLAGAIAFLPVQLETVFDLRFAPSDLFLILAVLLGVFVWRGVRSAWSMWHVGLLGLFVIGVFVKSLFGTVTQFDFLQKLGGLILLFSFYVCLTTLADGWGDLRRFMRIFVISVTVQNSASCAAFLWCKYTGSDDPLLMMLLSGSVDRLAGMLVDPNAYGGLLTVAFAMALLGGDRRNPLLPRWLQIVSLLSLSIGLLLTSSRSAWIGCAFLMLFGVMQNPRLLVALPVLLATGLAAVAYSMGSDGFDEMLTISSRQNTIDERVEINRNAWQMFIDHPWFGGGIGAFVEEHDIIVHNSAMWFLAEFGGVGFVIFVGFIGWFCVKGIAAYRAASAGHRPVIAALIAGHLAMIGFSLGVEALYQRYWWVVMGLLASAYVLALRDARAAPTEEPVRRASDEEHWEPARVLRAGPEIASINADNEMSYE
jgi:putative inorganic carbon (HCO3(-)) transporter